MRARVCALRTGRHSSARARRYVERLRKLYRHWCLPRHAQLSYALPPPSRSACRPGAAQRVAGHAAHPAEGPRAVRRPPSLAAVAFSRLQVLGLVGKQLAGGLTPVGCVARRPLTFLKYNVEGDLLVTCAKDHTPNLWYSDDGERIGTYSGHNGAVWTCDITGAWRGGHDACSCCAAAAALRRRRADSRFAFGALPVCSCAADSLTLVTASADTTAKLWDVPTGKNYFTFDFDRQGARGCAFSLGGREVVITVDPFMGTGSSIRIFKMFADRAERACPHVARQPRARRSSGRAARPPGLLTLNRAAAACSRRETRAAAGVFGPRGAHHARRVGPPEPHHHLRRRGRHDPAVGRGGALASPPLSPPPPFAARGRCCDTRALTRHAACVLRSRARRRASSWRRAASTRSR